MVVRVCQQNSWAASAMLSPSLAYAKDPVPPPPLLSFLSNPDPDFYPAPAGGDQAWDPPQIATPLSLFYL